MEEKGKKGVRKRVRKGDKEKRRREEMIVERREGGR
jgi:hypothetical protein